MNESTTEKVQNCTYCNKPLLPHVIQQQPTLPYIPNLITCLSDSNTTMFGMQTIYFNNNPYHKDCLTKFHQYIIKDDFEENLELNLTYSMYDVLNLVTDLSRIDNATRTTADLLKKIKDIICNHNTDYILCANPQCKRLILRRNAIVGSKTKMFQQVLLKQQSESNVSPDDKEYQQNSKTYRVLYFCSTQCDGYFSSKLRFTLEHIVNEANSKINDIKDRIKRTINMYENSGTRSQAEITKIKNILEAQERVKIKTVSEHTVELVRKTTKEWIG